MVGPCWGLWIDRLRESWVKEVDGWVQQQVGDSAVCGRRTGQVARCCGLRKEGHNTGRGGNEGRSGGIWYIGKCVCLMGSWAIDRKRSDVVEVRVLCWEVTVEGSMAGSGRG